MANDFSGDSDVIALYNFESGVLTSDSKNSNTLTDVNTAGTDTTNFKEGAASTVLDRTADEHFTIADAAMQSDYPLKSGTGNTTFSILGWVRITETSTRKGLVSKYETDGRRSLSLTIETNEAFRLAIGYSNGGSFEILHTSGPDILISGRFAHFKLTYDAGDWTIRVWDSVTELVVLAAGGSAVETISLVTVPWAIGSYRPDVGGSAFDGNLDEIIFFKRVVSDADQDSIIAGTYGAGGVTHQLAGSLNSASQLTGTLNLTQRLSGSLNSVSSTSGVLRLTQRMSASLNSSSVVSGTLRLIHGLSGSIQSASQVTGTLRLIQRLRGTINSISTLTGRLRLIQRISGLINSKSQITGNLTIDSGPVTHQLSGSILSRSQISGTLTEDKITEIILASGDRTLELTASGKRVVGFTASGTRTLQLTASGTKE